MCDALVGNKLRAMEKEKASFPLFTRGVLFMALLSLSQNLESLGKINQPTN